MALLLKGTPASSKIVSTLALALVLVGGLTASSAAAKTIVRANADIRIGEDERIKVDARLLQKGDEIVYEAKIEAKGNISPEDGSIFSGLSSF